MVVGTIVGGMGAGAGKPPGDMGGHMPGQPDAKGGMPGQPDAKGEMQGPKDAAKDAGKDAGMGGT